jgi:hypothetical protein
VAVDRGRARLFDEECFAIDLKPEFRSWWTVGRFVRAGFVLSRA